MDDKLVAPPDTDKEARFHAVSEAVVRSLLRGGPDDLRYATIARNAGVSRAWLYKYFGKDTSELLHFAARLFGEAFVDLDRPIEADDAEAWREEVVANTLRGFADVEAHPWTMQLYFRYRHDRGVLGQSLRDLRQRHRDKFVAEMPHMRRSAAFADAFTSIRLGLYFDWLDADFRRDNPLDRIEAMLRRLLQ